jgi:Ca-activated chloride channel family protein
MFGWHFVDVDYVHLVWGALAIVALLFVVELATRDALASFLSPVMQRRLTAQASLARTIVKLALVFGSMFAGVLALMRPQVDGEMETVPGVDTKADVLFVLDVSRSMLAEDAAPNRLARAKAEIGELVGKIEDARVGLIAFAGRAAPVCPLTPDHAFFVESVLPTVDTRSAGKGGSRIGTALKAAINAFPRGPGAKLIVLITDGDDQDPYSLEEAKKVAAAGIKIVAIGLGSEQGSEIILTDPTTGAKKRLERQDGKPVISKLDGDALRKIALATEGVYIPAGTAAVDLRSILETYVLPIVQDSGQTTNRAVPAERFQWPVLAAIVLLLAALWVGAGAGERTS